MSWALTRNALDATDYTLPPSRSLYVRLRLEVSEADLSPAPNEKLLQRQQRTFTLSSAWSGAPSNETDQAWKSLVEDDMGAFSISAKLFRQVNPSLETGVRVPYEPEDNGDLSILTYNWVKGERMPKPNFRTVHACQNWDNVVGWARENSVEHLMQYIRRPKEGLELVHVPCEEGVDCDGVY
ncbi:hypothetical protein BKA61DRAFT_630402 [Leptodontidium sp. MPI-SDFR-AT-0119]|nr:hypothetical protein BKA61DRAFT_630402 [Leptodontidium sp. MPI-SDFR-AT-0119]